MGRKKKKEKKDNPFYKNQATITVYLVLRALIIFILVRAVLRREYQSVFLCALSLILLGLSGSEMLNQAKEIGLPYAAEVFADRAYEDDGTLVARSKPGAMITDEDEAVRRVIRMILEHKVTSISGKEIEICPDSVCVHGDSPKALLFVKKIRSALEAEGIAIQPL